MNFSLLCILARFSVVLALWPPQIDPRLAEIRKMQIKIKAESNINGDDRIWSSIVLNIPPEFVLTADITRLIIKKESISEVLEHMKGAAAADIKKAVRADVEEEAKVDMKSTDKVDTEKAEEIFTEKVNKLVNKLRFYVEVVFYSNADTINTMSENVFQKMYLPANSFYSYFKLEDNEKVETGQSLKFQMFGPSYITTKTTTNVRKAGEDQVEVGIDLKGLNKITRTGSIKVVPRSGLTGPYYGCDVLLVEPSTQNSL